MCRASDLAKERKKLSKAERWEGKPKDRARVEQSRVESSRYCGRKHERNKQNCRALGKRVLNCNKLNHFPAQCLTTKRKRSRVITVQCDSESEFGELATVDYVHV